MARVSDGLNPAPVVLCAVKRELDLVPSRGIPDAVVRASAIICNVDRDVNAREACVLIKIIVGPVSILLLLLGATSDRVPLGLANSLIRGNSIGPVVNRQGVTMTQRNLSHRLDPQRWYQINFQVARKTYQPY